MNAKTRPEAQTPLQIARRLAADFAENAAERDVAGGTPKAERDALRRSGLLSLIIPREYGGLGRAGAKPCKPCANWPGSTARSPTSMASST